MSAATLVIGIGNPSRGDDALGPCCIERLETLALPNVECLTDFQLQVEYVLDLAGRCRVLFVDASVSAAPPFEFKRLRATPDSSYSTHAVSPAALLFAYRQHYGEAPPPAWVLAIRGESFALGAPLSPAAQAHLDAAMHALQDWLATPFVAACEEASLLPARREGPVMASQIRAS